MNIFYINNKLFTKHLLKSSLTAIIIFICIFPAIIGTHRKPDIISSYIQYHEFNLDIFFQAALIAIYKTYGVCSTGIDGIASTNYHHFYNIFLGCISDIINDDAFNAIKIYAPIIFIPTFILTTLLSIKEFIPEHGYIGKTYIFSLLLTSLSLYFTTISIYWGPFPNRLTMVPIMQSDSLILGLIFMLIFSISIKRQFTLFLYNKTSNIKTLFIYLLCIFSFILILGFSKIHCMHLFAFCILYLSARYIKYYTKFSLLSILFVLTSVIVGSLLFTPNMNNEQLNFSFFEVWYSRVPQSEWIWLPLIYGIPLWSLGYFLLNRMKILSFTMFLTRIQEKNFIMLEILFLLLFSSLCLTTIFGGSLGFNSLYYLQISLFIVSFSLVYIFSNLSLSFRTTRNFKDLNPAYIFVILCLAFISIIPFSHTAKTLFNPGTPEVTPKITINTSYSHKLFSSLESIRNNFSSAQKKDSVLWVPRDNPIFDTIPKEIQYSLPLWFVSITEIALLDGIPRNNPHNDTYFFGSYRKNPLDLVSLDLIKAKEYAADLGFKSLIVINSDSSFDNIVL